eukprot:scaffold11434_cov127-Isochrysis_galbana.AAC.10
MFKAGKWVRGWGAVAEGPARPPGVVACTADATLTNTLAPTRCGGGNRRPVGAGDRVLTRAAGAAVGHAHWGGAGSQQNWAARGECSVCDGGAPGRTCACTAEAQSV